MTYTTPVTDRVLSDVTTPTAKGYLNVSDWVRIYGNVLHVWNLEEIVFSLGLSFTTIATPTISTIPTTATVNALVTNIETLRLALAPVAGTVTLKTDWGGNRSPDYRDINDWERNISLMYEHITNNRHARCGIAIMNAGLTRNNGFRRFA